MKILALELSCAQGGIAWLDTEKQSARAPTATREGACAPQPEGFVREWPNDRKNSGPFFEHLAEVQKGFGKADRIIVGLGPGSYAGTRIAISAAIGLQADSQARLIGFPSICAIDCDANEYCVIGDARRQAFFFARIRNHGLIEGPDLMTEAELREKLDKFERRMAIFATERLSQFERAKVCYPSSKLLARLAGDLVRDFSQPPLEPMYLREPHITIPRK
jgi:tRNA threonylcarbamoyl adenosine modification protein YeaZ